MAERREQLGDLTVLCPPLTPISRAYAGGAPVLIGDLAQMPLLNLVNVLSQGRETGRLLLRHNDIERVILIREGDLGAMGGNGPQDKLGSTIRRSGRVTTEQFEQALAHGKKTQARIGQALIELGLLQPHELFDVIREQVTEMFCDCSTWTAGSFFMYRLLPNFPFPPAPPVSLTGLVLEAARRADELAQVRSEVGDDDTQVVLTGKMLDKGEALHTAHLAYAQLGEPPLSIQEITRRSRLSSFDVMQGIQRLLQLGIIAVVEEVPEHDASPVMFTDEQKADVDCVRLGFREIEQAIAIEEHSDEFHAAVARYLEQADPITKAVLHDIDDPTVMLDIHQLRMNIGALREVNRIALAQGVLNELLKFAAFQAGEMISPMFEVALNDRLRSVCGRILF